MNAEQAWQAVLGQLQMDMNKAAFNTWVRSAELVSYEDGVFTVGVHNAYARDWLESRLASTVNRILTGIMNRPETVQFIVFQRDSEPAEAGEELDRTPAGLRDPAPSRANNARSIPAIRLTPSWSAPATAWRMPPAWP